jgi:hypothetical protein
MFYYGICKLIYTKYFDVARKFLREKLRVSIWKLEVGSLDERPMD